MESEKYTDMHFYFKAKSKKFCQNNVIFDEKSAIEYTLKTLNSTSVFFCSKHDVLHVSHNLRLTKNKRYK